MYILRCIGQMFFRSWLRKERFVSDAARLRPHDSAPTITKTFVLTRRLPENSRANLTFIFSKEVAAATRKHAQSILEMMRGNSGVRIR